MFGDPTPRQLQVYAFVRRFFIDHGRPPTVREVSAGIGIKSPQGVAKHLDALVRKWLLRRVEGSRGRASYVPAIPELVVERVAGGQYRVVTTGPVLMSAERFRTWLIHTLATADRAG